MDGNTTAWRVLGLVGLGLAVPGCGGGGDGLAAAAALEGQPRAALEVCGMDTSQYAAAVHVFQDGVLVEDATVELNGTRLEWVPQPYFPYYYAWPATPWSSPLVLTVTRGGSTVTGRGEPPEAPVLTAPAPTTTAGPDQDLPVRWTSATDPDRFTVNAQWLCGPDCGTGVGFDVKGNARSFTVPAAALPPDKDVTLSVFAYNDGSFEGDIAPCRIYNPGMNIRAESFLQAVISRTAPDAGPGDGGPDGAGPDDGGPPDAGPDCPRHRGEEGHRWHGRHGPDAGPFGR